MPTNINGNTGIDKVQDGTVVNADIDTLDASKLTGSIAAARIANNTIDSAHIASGAVDDAHLATGITASKLTGALPAISGANLTGISSIGGATGVDFNDNVKARFGTGNDLEIYHDGTDSYIHDSGSGNLELRTNGVQIGIMAINGSEYMGKFVQGNQVELYYNNSKKIETTSAGATVSGALTATAGSGAMLKVQESGGSYAYLEAGGSVSYLEFKAGDKLAIREDNNANYVIFNGNHTIDHYGTTGNWMKMLFAGSTNNEYFISFRMSNNTQVGTIQTNGSTVSYNTSSDYRLKENVDYTWDATTRLKQLKPARFNWIADETNTVVDGFIAHEVEGIVPEAISGAKDAMEAAVLYQEGDELPEGKEVGDVKVPEQISPQSIDQSKLVPLLVKTIQELEARITAGGL